MIARILKEERGAFAIPVLYTTIGLLSLLLVVYGFSSYWISSTQENIQTKLDMSNMACYPNLNLENLADSASVTLEETEARKTFELLLAKQLQLDVDTLQSNGNNSVQQLRIDRFKIYQSHEVPVTLPGGRQILHAPAIESQITVFVRIPFLDRTHPFTFRSVTDLPQTP